MGSHAVSLELIPRWKANALPEIRALPRQREAIRNIAMACRDCCHLRHQYTRHSLLDRPGPDIQSASKQYDADKHELASPTAVLFLPIVRLEAKPRLHWVAAKRVMDQNETLIITKKQRSR